jgi:hypothetical protein
MLSPQEVAEAHNVVLMVIDGLGDQFFQAGPELLSRWRRGALTSVFPSSTAPAISSFMTGVAPEQHAVTGWHMYLREYGLIAKTLPFVPRTGGPSLTEMNCDPRRMLCRPSLLSRLPGDVTNVAPERIIGSAYNRLASGGVRGIGYRDMSGFFGTTAKLVRRNRNRQFVYAYWGELDHVAHQHGIGSAQASAHWELLQRGIAQLVDQISGTDTLLLITADHGFIDMRPESRIVLRDDHPKLAEMLALPLCGEPRSTFCYLRPGCAQAFEQYIEEHLAHAFELHASEELLAGGWFGIGTPAEQIHSRIGDYTLMPRADYVLFDPIGEEPGPPNIIGVHGGSSPQEMYVPLLTVSC